MQETKRPSKEMQVTIARKLALDPSTVSNFFMNARRRSIDKWRDDKDDAFYTQENQEEEEEDGSPCPSPEMQQQQHQQLTITQQQPQQIISQQLVTQPGQTVTLARFSADGQLKTGQTVLLTNSPAAVVQHLQQPSDLSPSALGGVMEL